MSAVVPYYQIYQRYPVLPGRIKPDGLLHWKQLKIVAIRADLEDVLPNDLFVIKTLLSQCEEVLCTVYKSRADTIDRLFNFFAVVLRFLRSEHLPTLRKCRFQGSYGVRIEQPPVDEMLRIFGDFNPTLLRQIEPTTLEI